MMVDNILYRLPKQRESPMAAVEIAYIDDNQDCLDIIKSAFEDMGVEIDIFDDPIQFYNIKKEYKIVISDFDMPGLNGQDFITLLKEKYPRTKTIIYSGIVDEIDIKNLEIDSFLLKPMEFESLMKVVRYLLFEYNNQYDQVGA